MVHIKYLAQSPAGTVNNITFFKKLHFGGYSYHQTSDSLPHEIGIKLSIFMRTFGVRTKTDVCK